jgi:hypothetical protein
MAKKNTRAKAPAFLLETPSGPVVLAWPDRASGVLPEVQRRAIAWTHVVRNRARWIRSATGTAEQDQSAREFLALVGVGPDGLQRLAQAGSVRVCIPYTGESHAWEARILPWEFIVSAATRALRTGPIVVTRWLERKAHKTVADRGRVLFVESAPGRLAQDWEFADECRLVQSYSGATQFERLESPTAEQLRAAVVRFRPGVVHLAGFDSHQGLELLKEPAATSNATPDGYLLAVPGGAEPLDAVALAQALVTEGHAPQLVFCNIWNSAARVAPLLAAAGAAAAIGFQDGMDDALAEIFLGSFYRGFAAAGDVQAGFEAGWAALQPQRRPLRGTGIALWRAGDAAQRPAMQAVAAEAAPARRMVVPLPVASEVDARTLGDYIRVTVEPEPQFSYALLHNNRDLFQRFLIFNLKNAQLRGLQVFVELHSNDGTYPWRQSFSLDDPVLDLSRKIRIALTSSLARTLDELLRTSLYVRVTWGPHEVYSETFPVTLAPVDQWADTDADRMFLPSFVFPRDRAVAHVLRQAEHFVTALRDDPAAGFDGYQSVDPDAADPAANVDRQVQALWYAIVYKVPASYINPPPTYTLASQRIRTPSEVTGGGYGTCVDLALMLAACLEAVEIHPVVFLLHDHAFAGYWRTDAARDAFLSGVTGSGEAAGAPQDSAPDATTATGMATARDRPGASWSFEGKLLLRQIRRAITQHHLIALETVGLSGRWSLAQAIETGSGYFDPAEAQRFLSMIDIRLARELGVTPLPLGARLG